MSSSWVSKATCSGFMPRTASSVEATYWFGFGFGFGLGLGLGFGFGSGLG
jgi:hypothetical protein